ncbi:MAG: monovalent cation/H+ antiporter complex subunit F [Actinomycetota bacterium]
MSAAMGASAVSTVATGFLEVVAYGCLAVLAGSLLLVVAFVLRSRGLVERALGLDTMLAVALNGIAATIVLTADPDLVVLAVLVAVLGFVGTVTVARFVERRGNRLTEEDR